MPSAPRGGISGARARRSNSSPSRTSMRLDDESRGGSLPRRSQIPLPRDADRVDTAKQRWRLGGAREPWTQIHRSRHPSEAPRPSSMTRSWQSVYGKVFMAKCLWQSVYGKVFMGDAHGKVAKSEDSPAFIGHAVPTCLVGIFGRYFRC